MDDINCQVQQLFQWPPLPLKKRRSSCLQLLPLPPKKRKQYILPKLTILVSPKNKLEFAPTRCSQRITGNRYLREG